MISFIEAKQDFLIRMIEGVACTTFKIKVQIGLTLQLASNNFTCLKEKQLFFKCFWNFTWRMCDSHPPKYQKTLCNVAPQPKRTWVSSPYSKFKSSLMFPEQRKKCFKHLTISCSRRGREDSIHLYMTPCCKWKSATKSSSKFRKKKYFCFSKSLCPGS